MNARFAALSILILLAGCKEKPEALPPSAPSMQVTIDATSIFIGERSCALPLAIGRLIEILGEPDETHNLANTIRVWNEQGIYCYTKPNTGTVYDISFLFARDKFDFSPTSIFSGTVTIESIQVAEGTSSKELIAQGFVRDHFIPGQLSWVDGPLSVFVDTRNNAISDVSVTLPQN